MPGSGKFQGFIPKFSRYLPLSGGEEPITVFSAGHRNWNRPGVFHPGRWTDHLEKLSEKAQSTAAERKETERRRSQLEHEARFITVDDSDLFPREKDGS